MKSKDAVGLKQKFQVFKSDLNSKIFDEPQYEESPQKIKGSAVEFSQKVFRNARNTVELIQTLKKTEFSQKQDEIIQDMEINTLILMELSMNILNK